MGSCAVLCCAVLCCAVLCCAVLCCAVLCWLTTCFVSVGVIFCICTELCCAVLCSAFTNGFEGQTDAKRGGSSQRPNQCVFGSRPQYVTASRLALPYTDGEKSGAAEWDGNPDA
jgi:hypothetical protein